MKALLAALLFCLALPALGQGVFKCKDAGGKITYASQECARLGLKDAGEVKDVLQVSPKPKPPPAPVARPRDDEEPKPAAKAPAPAPKAAEPERRCFKTAKGTRCNDVPDEKADAKGG